MHEKNGLKGVKNHLSPILLILAVTLFPTANATPNDSTSYPTTTGIEFTKSDDISIESESLSLRGRSVEVEYEFYNHSSQEISMLMAFPLTGFHVPREGNQIAWSMGQPSAWKFTVNVDGKKFGAKLAWRAIIDGVDKARILNKLGISVANPSTRDELYKDEGHLVSTSCLNYKFDKKKKDLLEKEGLAYKEAGSQNCLVPQWIAQAIHLWEAKFAPQKATRVKHTYVQWPGYWEYDLNESRDDTYGAVALRNQLQSASRRFGNAREYFYSYVLHTGGNWKGPIKKFRFKAQGPKNSWAWVEAPFPVKRESDTILSAELDNYKPRSKAEYLETARKTLRDQRTDEEKDITFHYVVDKPRVPWQFDE